MSVVLFVATEPPAHQQIERADTVPLSEIARFSPPPPQRGIFCLIPPKDLKDQRRRVSDPHGNNFRSPTVLICTYIYIHVFYLESY